MLSCRAGVDFYWKGDHMQISYFLANLQLGDSTQLLGVPSYFEALWYPHLFFDRNKSDI